MPEQIKTQKRKRSPALLAGLVVLFLGIVLLITLAMFASFDEVTNVFEAGKVDIVLTEPEWDPKKAEETVPNTFIDKDPTVTNKEDTVDTYVFLKVTVPYDDDPRLQIEYAYQDDNNPRKSGEIEYSAENATNTAKVPIYKFVATEKPVNSGEEWTDSVPLSTYYDHTYADNGDKHSYDQKVNPGWDLIDVKTNMVSRTFTYLYAYVSTTDTDESGQPLLAEVLPGATVKYPLFNKLYLLNFRERAEQKNDQGHIVSTAFPDPARNYSVRLEAYGIQANFLRPNNTTTRNPKEVWMIINPSYKFEDENP